eukprot:m.136101 g.136101  ORF g.136101 m.136101 type:complete len:479 (-) comp15864_c0_seq2:109-1545(-)
MTEVFLSYVPDEAQGVADHLQMELERAHISVASAGEGEAETVDILINSSLVVILATEGFASDNTATAKHLEWIALHDKPFFCIKMASTFDNPLIAFKLADMAAEETWMFNPHNPLQPLPSTIVPAIITKLTSSPSDQQRAPSQQATTTHIDFSVQSMPTLPSDEETVMEAPAVAQQALLAAKDLGEQSPRQLVFGKNVPPATSATSAPTSKSMKKQRKSMCKRNWPWIVISVSLIILAAAALGIPLILAAIHNQTHTSDNNENGGQDDPAESEATTTKQLATMTAAPLATSTSAERPTTTINPSSGPVTSVVTTAATASSSAPTTVASSTPTAPSGSSTTSTAVSPSPPPHRPMKRTTLPIFSTTSTADPFTISTAPNLVGSASIAGIVIAGLLMLVGLPVVIVCWRRKQLAVAMDDGVMDSELEAWELPTLSRSLENMAEGFGRHIMSTDRVFLPLDQALEMVGACFPTQKILHRLL